MSIEHFSRTDEKHKHHTHTHTNASGCDCSLMLLFIFIVVPMVAVATIVALCYSIILDSRDRCWPTDFSTIHSKIDQKAMVEVRNWWSDENVFTFSDSENCNGNNHCSIDPMKFFTQIHSYSLEIAIAIEHLFASSSSSICFFIQFHSFIPSFEDNTSSMKRMSFCHKFSIFIKMVRWRTLAKIFLYDIEVDAHALTMHIYSGLVHSTHIRTI